MDTKEKVANPRISEMFEIGAHFGFTRSRRHPSQKPFIFGNKSNIEIFDLEKTSDAFDSVLLHVKELGSKGKKILFVGGKNEARDSVVKAAEKTDMPYVAGRWIGGTLTNFREIRKRVERMLRLQTEKEKGELAKYTKKERLLIDREIEKLGERFGGLVSLTEKPAALIAIDSAYEHIAVDEAKKAGVEVIALCGTDCDIREIDHVFPGNDASQKTIEYFLNNVAEAYLAGKAVSKETAPEKPKTVSEEK